MYVLFIQYNCISKQALRRFYYVGGDNSKTCNATNLTMSIEYMNQCGKNESCKQLYYVATYLATVEWEGLAGEWLGRFSLISVW